MANSVEYINGLDLLRDEDGFFINSPLRDYGGRKRDNNEVLPALGLAYIATLAHERGFNVGLIDAEYHGLPIKTIVDMVNTQTPRWLGMNVLTPTIDMVFQVSKGIDPDIHLVIGGPHATAMPERTLRLIQEVHPKTILIAGEAENAVVQLLDGADCKNIAGAYWMEDGKVRHSGVLSAQINPNHMPILDRRFLPNDPSIDAHTGRREARVLTARYCPFNCTFCAGARETTNLVTKMTKPERVAEELRGLVIDQKVDAIRFVDDLAISSERRIREIFEAWNNEGLGTLAWDATGRANILAKMSPELIDYMVENGLHECAIGIESGSERMRKLINKQVSEAEIFKSIDVLVQKGVKVKGYMIVGLRSETAEETRQTLDLAKRLVIAYGGMFRASIFVFRPYPGTQEWDELLKLGWTEDELLEMDSGYGTGDRAKHMVVPKHQYSELAPYDLANMVNDFNDWQNDIINKN